jgi:hypothetical protein
MPTKLTTEILNAAVLGFEQQKRRIDEQIAEIRQTLGGSPKTSAAAPEGARPKRKVSAAARRRMAAAQRKRWAAIKAQSAQPAVRKAPTAKKAARKKAVAKKAVVKAPVKAVKKTASRKPQKKAVKAAEAVIAATA